MNDREKLDKAIKLLRIAKCPNNECDNRGMALSWSSYLKEPVPYPCQWCEEKRELLKIS